MKFPRATILKGALLVTTLAGTMAASTAMADSYTVCNRWNECWRVHDRYTDYPPDAQIVWHDDAWRAKNEHDSRWHWLSDPADDHGWYDRDGVWHAFAHPTPP